MQITVEIRAEITGTLTGDPSDVYGKVDAIERALCEIELEYRLTVSAQPMALTSQNAQPSPAHKSLGEPLREARIECFMFDVRTFNCLKIAGIHTAAELVNRSPAELAAITGLGDKSIQRVEAGLAEYGLSLRLE